MGSVFVTVAVTVERYFAIVHPLKHFSGKKFLLVACVIASVLYNIPKFYEFETRVVRKVSKGQTFASTLAWLQRQTQHTRVRSGPWTRKRGEERAK